MTSRCTEESFLQDVASHEMQILREDGLYRHIRFRRPDTMYEHFDLVTWPGTLCITGDRETFVFSREADMLAYFQRRQQLPTRLFIYPGDWAKKLQAPDSDSVTVYSEEKFAARIREWLDEMGPEGADPELRDAVDEEVLSEADQGEPFAMRAALEFEHKGTPVFEGFGEWNVREYSYHYVWCCFAIVWGAQQYFSAKNAEPKAA